MQACAVALSIHQPHNSAWHWPGHRGCLALSAACFIQRLDTTCHYVALNLRSPLAPSSPQAIYAMNRDHRSNPQQVTGTGEATGAAAVPAAVGPCGPANSPVSNTCSPATQSCVVYYVCNGEGAWQVLTNPRLGEGPSSAPPCPGPNYVWLEHRWRPVVSRRPYAMVAAGCSNPSGGNRGTVPAPAAPAPTLAPRASAAAPAQTGSASGGRTSQEQTRPHQRLITKGYQLLLWGPRRDSTTIPQVQLAVKDLLERVGQGLPTDLLGGRGSWLGQQHLLFDLSAAVVQRLTAGRVGALKYHVRRSMNWRSVFLHDGSVISSAPEAYRALEQNTRERVLYFTRPALSNRFIALEPAGFWCEDACLDTFSSDSETGSITSPGSPSSSASSRQQQEQSQEQEEQQQPSAQQHSEQSSCQEQQQRDQMPRAPPPLLLSSGGKRTTCSL